MVSLWYESWCTSIQSLHFYKWLLILNSSNWILVVDILTLILLTLLTFTALPILWKTISLSEMVSLCCELLCKLLICTLKSDQWITIWWAKSVLECLLLIFVYSNSKFIVTWENVDFECWYIRTEFEENLFKISNFTFAILLFSHQNTLTKLPFWVL